MDAAFHDVPASAFPIEVSLEDLQTGEVLWSAVVATPGALCVPGFDRPVRGRMRFADGAAAAYPPDDDRAARAAAAAAESLVRDTEE